MMMIQSSGSEIENGETRATSVKRFTCFIVIQQCTSAQLLATSSCQPVTPPPSPVRCATGRLHQSWRSCNQNGRIMKNGGCQSGVPHCAGCCWALAHNTNSTLSIAFKLRTQNVILNYGLKCMFFCSASFSLMNSVCYWQRNSIWEGKKKTLPRARHTNKSMLFIVFSFCSIFNLPPLLVCCAKLICATRLIPHNEISIT